MASKFWVGGGAQWNNSNTTSWSLSSGGAGGAALPSSADNVFFDANSGGGNVVIGTGAICGDFSTSGFTGTFNGAFPQNSFQVFGNITLGCNINNQIDWGAKSGSVSITSNSFSLQQGLHVGGAQDVGVSYTGTFTLNDDLNITGGTGTGQFLISSNSTKTTTFNANNHNLNAKIVFITQNGTATNITMGSGTWTFSGTGDVWKVTGATITANTSTLKFTDTTNTTIIFTGNGSTYNNVWFSRGACTSSTTIVGSNTFNDFKDDGTAAHSILFTAGTTQTVSSFTVSGTVGNLITINSTSTATHTLSKSSGTVNCTFLDIQHSVATGGATWNATSSTDHNSVSTAGSGWIISPFFSLSDSVTASENIQLIIRAPISFILDGTSPAWGLKILN